MKNSLYWNRFEVFSLLFDLYMVSILYIDGNNNCTLVIHRAYYQSDNCRDVSLYLNSTIKSSVLIFSSVYIKRIMYLR